VRRPPFLFLKSIMGLRDLLPFKPPAAKTMVMPCVIIASLFPRMDGYEWAKTALWMLLAIWLGSVMTEKLENSEWRKQLRADADVASRKGEEEKAKKEKDMAKVGGSSKKNK
jgi:hypothetical protein